MIAKEEANASIARDRVSYIRDPGQNTSNYESWFPMNRPMHAASLLILLSISIFVTTFSLLMICSFLGVKVTVYTNTVPTYQSGLYYWIYSQITPFSIVTLIALVSVLAYFLKRR
jgi:hypothetical protein